jgi:hypothetical protein
MSETEDKIEELLHTNNHRKKMNAHEYNIQKYDQKTKPKNSWSGIRS